MSNSYPRETTEYIPVEVTLTANGTSTVITSGVQFQLVPYVTLSDTPRPVVDGWSDAVVIGNLTAYLLTPQDVPGRSKLWAKVTDSSETPVIDCGDVDIT